MSFSKLITNHFFLCLATTSSERLSPTRRQFNTSAVSSTVRYQQQQQQQQPIGSASAKPAASYRVYAHSEPPPPSSFQAGPGTVITQVTEETQVIQIPPQHPQQQHNEVTYTVQGKQPKFEPVAFQVSTMKENVRPPPPPPSSSSSTIVDQNDPNPFKIFGAKLKSRPNSNIVPSYDDQPAANYSRQTSSSTGSQYQQFTSQQTSSSSYPPTQPNFSKIR